MKVLITGASGYLGQHFLHCLLQRPEQFVVYATYRSLEGFEASVLSHPLIQDTKSDVLLHKLDLTDESDVENFFHLHGPFDICFHLAALASPQVCQQNPQRAHAANAPRHFFYKLRNTVVVALSTDQVYCGKKAPYTEDSQTGPVNVYAQSKCEMEHLLLADESRSKPAVCLRSSIILGPDGPFGNSHGTFLQFCKSREGIETTFYTDECRSVINVFDVCHSLMHFLDTVQSKEDIIGGIFNMGGPERVSRMAMASAVAKHCGFSDLCFIPAEKSKQISMPNSVPSPLDISMSSQKLEELIGRKFKVLSETIQDTFP
jgi:nucleoside-diphosphate-sugar epimerase